MSKIAEKTWIAKIYKKKWNGKRGFFSPKEAEALETDFEKLKESWEEVKYKKGKFQAKRYYFLVEIPYKLFLKNGSEIMNLIRDSIKGRKINFILEARMGTIKTTNMPEVPSLKQFSN